MKTQPPVPDRVEYLSTWDAADCHHVRVMTLRHWIRTGNLPAEVLDVNAPGDAAARAMNGLHLTAIGPTQGPDPWE